MIKGAIFDLDGTLLDSMSIWDTIGENYLRSLKIEPKENLKETFKMFSLEQSAEYYREHYGVTLSVQEIMSGVNAMISDYYVKTAQLKHGAAEFLSKLYKSNVNMCVATVTDSFLAEAALKRCGVLELFAGVITCAQVGCGKENPHVYREALKILGTNKNQTVVFEDALHALQTAKADGFKTAAVYDSHEENQEEMQAISDFYIQDFSDVTI